MDEKLSFSQFRNRHMFKFYEQTRGKSIMFKGNPVAKFEAFAEIYNRYKQGNSEKEISLIVSGMSVDFTVLNK